MWWGQTGDYGWVSMGGGMVGMLFFWILALLGVIALVRGAFSSDKPKRLRDKTALDILKERYARGEIERAEFEQKKHDLGS